MALADYRLCDVCQGKAFYDSNLNYQFGSDGWNDNPPFREDGEEQFSNPETNNISGVRLDNLGDWAVICTECAKTYKTVVVEINPNKRHHGIGGGDND